MIKYYIKFCFSNNLTLHPYLLRNLQRRGQYPLKEFQEQSLRIINNNQNVFVNSCTGSGKTLAYLVPIMNNLLNKRSQENLNSQKGAIILTLNKELVSQIYTEIKSIDTENYLQTFRIGPVRQSKQSLDEKQHNQNNQGFVNFILWNKIDILIATPQALMNQITIFKGQRKTIIDPQLIAIDEADLLLQLDKNVSRNTDKFIKFIREHTSNSSNIKYLLTASSFPKKYKGDQSSLKLMEYFKQLNLVQGINKHKLPQSLQLFYIQMKSTEEEKLLQQKKSFIKRIVLDRKTQRIIIFCKQKSHIQNLNQFITNELCIPNTFLYAQLKSDQRLSSLNKFSSGESKILISSQLGSRGLDFSLPVDCIIEYDMAENVVSFLNRAGRTARNNLYGQVITFVEEKNKLFFEHLKNLRHDGSQLDEMFSRKRSYSKLYKQ